MKQVCAKYAVKIKCGWPYHPQSQGQVENLNRFKNRVKNCLRHFLLDYPHSEHADVRPHLLRDIDFFLNHSWHHTIRSTPYAVFFGRTELRNVGKVSAQNEYMEEDFLYLNDGEEHLVMDVPRSRKKVTGDK